MIQIRILELNTFDGKIHRPKAYIENLKIQWRNIGVKCKLKKIYQKLINDTKRYKCNEYENQTRIDEENS